MDDDVWNMLTLRALKLSYFDILRALKLLVIESFMILKIKNDEKMYQNLYVNILLDSFRNPHYELIKFAGFQSICPVTCTVLASKF